MQARITETPTYIRHRSSPIERSQSSNSIYQEQGSCFCGCAEPHRVGKAQMRRRLLDQLQVLFYRLVRHEDESRIGIEGSDARIRLEKHGFIVGPGGACHQSGSSAAPAKQRVLSTDGRDFLNHAVVARVAQDPDTVRSYAQAGETGTIIG
jgi:hypothetical protein